MKLYTIIGGVNGCGKSSLTGALKAERSDLGLLIDVDKLAAQLGSPVEGGKAAVRKIDECLEKGISFTQETTLSGARTERTIRRAKERGYTIRLYYIGLDTMEESLSRLAASHLRLPFFRASVYFWADIVAHLLQYASSIPQKSTLNKCILAQIIK